MTTQCFKNRCLLWCSCFCVFDFIWYFWLLKFQSGNKLVLILNMHVSCVTQSDLASCCMPRAV